MNTSIAKVGFSENADSYQAGFEAASLASDLDGTEPGWQLAILISTSRHDPGKLRDGVQAVIGKSCKLIGGYGVGIITNAQLGYDGYQVGILLLAPSINTDIDIFLAENLADNEVAVGAQLGKLIQHTEYNGDPSAILFYDSVNRLSERFRMNMATHLLGGMQGELAAWPSLVGAGMVGDMQCQETFQWFNDGVLQQSAIALVLSGAMRIDSTVMHGCRPASGYHQITKTDENVVLEIDGVPALDRISALLGPESGKTWRDYSFFVTLGVNRGDKFGEFHEDLYANRLCMGVDKERKGLVMFEPDLLPGAEVQLMRRDMDFGYIREKVDALLADLDGRRPVFAFYIDCAGRAAAYSGFDAEEAVEVQKALGDIPLLGFYSGVEIGTVAGEPVPLDWTGVLAIASEADSRPSFNGHISPSTAEKSDATSETADTPSDEPALQLDTDELRERIRTSEAKIETLTHASRYYAALTDELAGQNVKNDSNLSMRNNELRIKNQGFAVLSNLQSKMQSKQTLDQLCRKTIEEVNATLKMDKTLVLFEQDGYFSPAFWSGFTEQEAAALKDVSLPYDAEWMENGHMLANRRSGKSEAVQKIKQSLPLPFFVGVPIQEADKTIGLLLSARMKEARPFYPPLEMGDINTFKSISGFLSATHQLNRQRENLEELNRTLEQKVIERTADLHEALGELEVKNKFIRKTFGRYMSDEVVEKILESPDGLNMGGQTLPVTILFSDLRGFSAISETLSPEAVVEMLNIYLEEMTRIVFKYSGTINEFMGDGILIVFGAPTVRPDDAEHAVACAMEMQMAMDGVNARIKARGYPELDMGIGINTGHVVAGNVGSDMRSKYAVVGSAVNMAARVESFTVGGQVLITQSTLDAVAPELKVVGEFSTNFKGIKEPVGMYNIAGIAGDYNLYLPEVEIEYQKLQTPLALQFEDVKGKTSSGEMQAGSISELADKYGILVSPVPLELRANLKISMDSTKLPDDAYIYAKVMRDCGNGRYEVNFTFMTRETRLFFDHARQPVNE